jgi:hypothetical protein
MSRPLLLSCLLALAVVSTSCDPGCGNEVTQVATSPSGSMTILAFVRSCGATTGFSTQVSIVRGVEKQVSGAGNVFVVEGRPPLGVRWLSDSEVVVSRPGPGRIVLQETEVKGVKVAYEY